MKWNGPEGLKPLLVDVGVLKVFPGNPRVGNIDRIADSLLRFGQMKPIAYQKSTGSIVAGNHTFLAASEKLGWSHIAAVSAELDDEEALAYAIADNRTADVGGYDRDRLADALERLSHSGKIAGTGYTKTEVEDELARLRDVATSAVARVTTKSKSTVKAGPLMKDLVLAYDPDRLAELTKYVKIVQRDRGLRDASEVIFETLRDAARAES